MKGARTDGAGIEGAGIEGARMEGAGIKGAGIEARELIWRVKRGMKKGRRKRKPKFNSRRKKGTISRILWIAFGKKRLQLMHDLFSTFSCLDKDGNGVSKFLTITVVKVLSIEALFRLKNKCCEEEKISLL